ncbi:MAG: cyanophycinase [Acidobacteriota bacterium]|nr:cyanophycinase [Acidobacteriota bacterium]
MELSRTQGRLVVIGGGEDKEGDCEILKEFLRLARGAKARVVVMTVATTKPEELGSEYVKAFKRLGVDDVKVVDVSSREDAKSKRGLKLIEDATGIFFTGGDQLHITTLLGGTVMHELLQDKFEKGTVLAGTSAGAAMMSNSMFIRGKSDETPRFGGMEIGPGMDFLTGAVIDTHFSQRGRIGRLLTAVAHYPQDIGIGIDENTAMIVQETEFEVIGEGAVTVVDASDITYTNLPNIGDGDALALYNVKLHVLPAGHRFDLGDRRPIIEEARDKNGKRKESGSKGKQASKRAKG